MQETYCFFQEFKVPRESSFFNYLSFLEWSILLTNSWAAVARCCTQGTSESWRGGCSCWFALSVFPCWSGRRWGGSGLQAQCWVGGWCGWHTCRRGFRRTASSWTLVLETPRWLLRLPGNRPELSWHIHGTHSRTFEERGDQSRSERKCEDCRVTCTIKQLSFEQMFKKYVTLLQSLSGLTPHVAVQSRVASVGHLCRSKALYIINKITKNEMLNVAFSDSMSVCVHLLHAWLLGVVRIKYNSNHIQQKTNSFLSYNVAFWPMFIWQHLWFLVIMVCCINTGPKQSMFLLEIMKGNDDTRHETWETFPLNMVLYTV